jgi:DHA1 family bicyclomycin/chloramphenicol resistance-like MFS transporter
VTRLGIDGLLRYSTGLMLASGVLVAALAFTGVGHPAAIVVPMFLFMIALMTTMPQATAGALSAFAQVAGSAASLLLFCQFIMASTAALIVGMTFDGTQRPMAATIAGATLLVFVAFQTLVRRRAA